MKDAGEGKEEEEDSGMVKLQQEEEQKKMFSRHAGIMSKKHESGHSSGSNVTMWQLSEI